VERRGRDDGAMNPEEKGGSIGRVQRMLQVYDRCRTERGAVGGRRNEEVAPRRKQRAVVVWKKGECEKNCTVCLLSRPAGFKKRPLIKKKRRSK